MVYLGFGTIHLFRHPLHILQVYHSLTNTNFGYMTCFGELNNRKGNINRDLKSVCPLQNLETNVTEHKLVCLRMANHVKDN